MRNGVKKGLDERKHVNVTNHLLLQSQEGLFLLDMLFYPPLFKNFLLEYSCFTMLCQFLLYNKVNQLYVYIYPLFFGFPSHLGHHRALSRVPCAIQFSLVINFIHSINSVYMSIPFSQFILHPFPPGSIHTSVLQAFE